MERPRAPEPARPRPAVPAAVVARAAGGDAEAIDAWFRAEHPAVFRLCVGFLADAAEADDLAQDTMLHLLDNLSAFDPTRSYEAWRNTVVLNRCRDRARRIEARRRAEAGARELELPERLPHPARDAERREVRAILAAALAALPPREREAFVLRDLQGSPTREVAAAMGVQEASVRSLLTLARRRLRGIIGERALGGAAEGAGP